MRTRNMRRQDTNGKNDAVARALGGARWVALGAVLAKIASVACTQIVLRLAPVEVLGIASARLEQVLTYDNEGFHADGRRLHHLWLIGIEYDRA